MEQSKNWDEYAAVHEADVYELIKTIARIPAPSGKEEKRAQFCLDWLKEHGADDAYIDEAGNVIWLYESRKKAGKNEYEYNEREKDCTFCERLVEADHLIVFDAHMDIVFPDETELPLFEENGRIYCPGIGDDTANLAVLLLMAAYAAQEKPDLGAHDLLFVCGVCEEGLGNLKGVREICRIFGARIKAFIGLDLGRDAYINKAVGSVRYRITVQTKGGHSYACFGNTNANAELALLIQKLYSIEVPTRGKTTYNVGMISGGTSVNTIAQQAEMLYEIRSDDEQDLAELRVSFEDVIRAYEEVKPSDANVIVEVIGERPCESEVDEAARNELFQYVEQTVLDAVGKLPVPKSGSTDCNIPLSMGIPSVCVGTYIGAGAHTREEYIEKEPIAEGLKLGMRLLFACKEL